MTHRFSSTYDAYNACQCDDGIADGDVLVIPVEGVVGLAGTWPVAITVNFGALAIATSDVPLARIMHEFGWTTAHVARAIHTADSMGYPVRPEWRGVLAC